MTLAYASVARLPSERAHGLQIVENCAALAEAGANLTLYAARRRAPTSDGAPAADPRDHSGVGRVFALERLPCLDLTGEDNGWPFYLTASTFALALVRRLRAHGVRPDVLYTRDPLVLLLAARWLPGTLAVFESHQMAVSPRGRRLLAGCARRAALAVTMTAPLERYLRELGARRTLVAPNAVRDDRFAALPARQDARASVGLPRDGFVVGYVGRLETLGMQKGVDVVVDAAALLPDVPLTLVIVGGPAATIEALRQRWVAHGLRPDRFVSPGSVAPAEVPQWLAALDVGTITLPDTRHFAACASPMKVPEYLAAGLPIVASDLPAMRESLADGETALLVPADDPIATAAALGRLYHDPALRRRLGESALRQSREYRLGHRARRILDAIGDVRREDAAARRRARHARTGSDA